MTTRQLQELDARVRVLGIVLQELCRALPRTEAAGVAELIHRRMGEMPAVAVSADVDAATVRELGPLLDALGGET